MPNKITFCLTVVFTLSAAVAAIRLRNPVHCALSAALAFAGLAVAFLGLDAEFIAFAQILVYVGAISILSIFAVLLTRGTEVEPTAAVFSRSWITGIAITLGTAAAILVPIFSSSILYKIAPAVASAPVQMIGTELMTHYLLPMEVMGLLLTSALIGAVVIAMSDRPEKKDDSSHPSVTRYPSAESKPATKRDLTTV
ncbi:MAG: dehydrogenase subunit [Verrucomicrobiales bacterium]|nr:dehydrogenase subunit [Verrucomicrobiales bacterium]